MLRMADDAQLVIGVAGRIGSGKCQVAQCLRDRFEFQYLRYSLVLAEWYHADPAAKAQLQELGWNVMSGDKQRELNRRLIAHVEAKRDCAIDGLRHPIDYGSLQAAFSSRFFLTYVDTPAEVRFERLRGRYVSYQDFLIGDSHPVESNIDMLIPLASVVLLGALPLEQLRAEVQRLVHEFRSGGKLGVCGSEGQYGSEVVVSDLQPVESASPVEIWR
jgi:dephospho-CoA kinase